MKKDMFNMLLCNHDSGNWLILKSIGIKINYCLGNCFFRQPLGKIKAAIRSDRMQSLILPQGNAVASL